MSLKRTLITSIRVIKQLRHDHRTVALIVAMPTVLLTILYYVFYEQNTTFNSVAPLLLGLIPFTLMFIVTSVAVLRERMSGTLERLLVSPATKAEIVVGYAIAFALLAFVSATIVSLVAMTFFDVEISGGWGSLLLVAVLSGVLGMSFGLTFSAFANNEFQAVQFMPLFVMPQLFTCGIFVARDQMAEPLQYFADLMPLTYVVKGIEELKVQSNWNQEFVTALAVIIVFILAALIAGALSLRENKA